MIPGGSNGAGYAKGKAVEQYSLDGELIAVYPSGHQAGEATGIPYASICHCCKNEIKTTGLFMWKYVNSDKEIVPLTVQDVINRGRAVNQYSLDGEFIKQYPSLKQASLETGINSSLICRVCKKNGHTAGGFKWAYAGENISSKEYKQIGQYDKQGNLINQFPTPTEASRATGIHNGDIIAVCKGRRITAGGYLWRYI